MAFHYYTIILILDRQYCSVSVLVVYILHISLLGSIFSGSFLTVSELFCDEVVKTFVILFANLSPVASVAFQIVLLEAVLSASVADCLTWSRSPWLYLLLKFLLMFLPIFLLMFLTKHKN